MRAVGSLGIVGHNDVRLPESPYMQPADGTKKGTSGALPNRLVVVALQRDRSTISDSRKPVESLGLKTDCNEKTFSLAVLMKVPPCNADGTS